MSAEMDLSRLLPGLDIGVSRTVEPHPNNGLATVRLEYGWWWPGEGSVLCWLLVYDDNESLMAGTRPLVHCLVHRYTLDSDIRMTESEPLMPRQLRQREAVRPHPMVYIITPARGSDLATVCPSPPASHRGTSLCRAAPSPAQPSPAQPSQTSAELCHVMVGAGACRGWLNWTHAASAPSWIF